MEHGVLRVDSDYCRAGDYVLVDAMTYLYVVAASLSEAKELAPKYGWFSETGAAAHLKECQAPPTDPYYAAKLRVYRVAKERKDAES